MNETLNDNARKWAVNLAENVGRVEHELNTGEGENLYWSWTSKTDFTVVGLEDWVIYKSKEAVKSWYSRGALTGRGRSAD